MPSFKGSGKVSEVPCPVPAFQRCLKAGQLEFDSAQVQGDKVKVYIKACNITKGVICLLFPI